MIWLKERVSLHSTKRIRLHVARWRKWSEFVLASNIASDDKHK